MILLLIIIMFILLFILFNYFYKFIIWASDWSETTPKITFKAFRKIYCLYPSKWVLRDTYVDYYPKKDYNYVPNYISNYISVDFKHFHDYLLYCKFKEKIKRDRDHEKQLEYEKTFIKYLQKDINDYREENLNELKKLINK